MTLLGHCIERPARGPGLRRLPQHNRPEVKSADSIHYRQTGSGYVSILERPPSRSSYLERAHIPLSMIAAVVLENIARMESA